MKKIIINALVIALVQSAVAQSVYTKERTVTKIAEGIYAIQHKDGPGGRIRGNTTVIIGDKDVLVVDAPSPYSAKEDIADIRKWTSKPVRYLVNTHWHPDHNRGNMEYAKAFPGLSVISHVNMPELLLAFEPGNLERLQKRSKEDTTGVLKAAVEELKDYIPTAPNVTFDKEMTIDLGNRKVFLKYEGPADTKADVMVFIPAEKIFIAGDLLVYPIPFFLACYPYQWIKLLEKLSEQDFRVIVPGHGKVFYDNSFLKQVLLLMKTIRDQVVNEVHKRGSLSAQLIDVKKVIDVSAFKKQFAGADPDSMEEFDVEIDALIALFFNQIDK